MGVPYGSGPPGLGTFRAMELLPQATPTQSPQAFSGGGAPYLTKSGLTGIRRLLPKSESLLPVPHESPAWELCSALTRPPYWSAPRRGLTPCVSSGAPKKLPRGTSLSPPSNGGSDKVRAILPIVNILCAGTIRDTTCAHHPRYPFSRSQAATRSWASRYWSSSLLWS